MSVCVPAPVRSSSKETTETTLKKKVQEEISGLGKRHFRWHKGTRRRGNRRRMGERTATCCDSANWRVADRGWGDFGGRRAVSKFFSLRRLPLIFRPVSFPDEVFKWGPPWECCDWPGRVSELGSGCGWWLGGQVGCDWSVELGWDWKGGSEASRTNEQKMLVVRCWAFHWC